jgi:hypothetical protein
MKNLKASKSERERKEIEREKRKGYTEVKIYEYGYNNIGELDPESKRLVLHEIYDKEGNVVTSRDNEGLKLVNKYNNKGDNIETQVFMDEELQITVKNKYNNKGDKIEETVYDAQGELDHKVVYEKKKRKDYTDVKIYEYGCNDFGEFDPESKELGYQYTLDNEGNIVSDEDSKYVNIYNDKGLIIEIQCFDNEELNYTTKYKYNDNCLLIEETEYNTQGEPYGKRVYEYSSSLKTKIELIQ